MADEPNNPHQAHTPPDGDGPNAMPVARPVDLSELMAPVRPPNELLLTHVGRPSIWVDLGIFLLAVPFVLFIPELLCYLVLWIVYDVPFHVIVDPNFGQHAQLILPITMMRMVLTVVFLAILLALRRQSRASIGMRMHNILLDLVVGLLALGAAYALIFGWVILRYLINPDFLTQGTVNAERLMQLIPPMHPLVLGVLSLGVGIYEELLFRGFLMTRLRRVTGHWWLAILISTVIFTAPHMIDQTTVALVPIIILSLVFSVVTILRRSLIPAIVAHFLFNWSQFLGLYYQSQGTWT